MIYPSYITITDDDLEKAKQAALAITEEEYEAFLNNWEEWKRQERFEVAENIEWDQLELKRISLRKSLRNLLNEKVKDPVFYLNKQYSLKDLLRHWVETGLDLKNNPLSKEDICNLKRVHPIRLSLGKSKNI